MITRINSVMNQLTLAGSAALGTPAAVNAAVHFAASQPSTVVEPIVRLTLSPAPGVSIVLNDSPSLLMKSLARSQFENFDHGPTKSWKWQVAGSTDTETGFLAWKVSRSGLT